MLPRASQLEIRSSTPAPHAFYSKQTLIMYPSVSIWNKTFYVTLQYKEFKCTSAKIPEVLWIFWGLLEAILS